MNKTIKNLLQPTNVVIISIVVAVVSVGVAYLLSSKRPSIAYVPVTSGAIVQEVDASAVVAAADALDLSFRSGGQISYAGPAVGTHVSAGTTLASLSAADLRAQVEQAQAQLASQNAQLATLMAGATPQNLAVSQTAVTNAQGTLAQDKQNVIQASQDGYVKADDAIHNKVDQFFTNPRSGSPTLVVTSSNSQQTLSAQADRAAMEQTLSAWQTYVASLPTVSAGDTSSVDIVAVETQTTSYETQVQNFLNEIATILSNASPSGSTPISVLQGYQSSVATARSNMASVISELNTTSLAAQGAVSALATAQAQLNVTQSPPTQNAIAVQQAAVAAAQASVDLAQAQLGKTVIMAPIAGTITVNNAHIGETAAVGTPVISMISNSLFEMDVYVSQTDVAKLKTADVASVTLDAYSGVTFAAHVASIDPAATTQDGVSSYKVTLQFDANDPRVQQGMTGSVKITTDTHSTALSVPTSAILTEGTNTFVFVRSGSGETKVPVTTGITSTAGMTEIISGVSAADYVRTFGNDQ